MLREVGLFIENLTIVQIYNIMAYISNILDSLKIDIDMMGIKGGVCQTGKAWQGGWEKENVSIKCCTICWSHVGTNRNIIHRDSIMVVGSGNVVPKYGCEYM